MDKPQISIIVPVYNVERYLPQCLDSLINQTFNDVEIICVNDGSTDGSFAILERYAKTYERIKVISQENSGASAARNTALDRAAGSYIMFVDSDDWIDLNTCEYAIQAMAEYDVDLVMWDYIREFPSASKPKNIFNHDVVFDEDAVRLKLHRRMVGVVGDELTHPENADALCTIWGKLYKAEYIQKNEVRFCDIKEIGTYEDGLFNLDALKYVNKAVYINKPLYHYRKANIGSVTNGYKPKLYQQRQILFEKLEEYIRINHCPDIYKEALNNRIALSALELGLNVMEGNFSARENLRMLNEFIAKTEYKAACAKMEFKYFPLHWKLLYGCAKHKCTIGLYALLLCIKIMKN